MVYLVPPGMQVHDQILGLRIPITDFAFITMWVPRHFLWHISVFFMHGQEFVILFRDRFRGFCFQGLPQNDGISAKWKVPALNENRKRRFTFHHGPLSQSVNHFWDFRDVVNVIWCEGWQSTVEMFICWLDSCCVPRKYKIPMKGTQCSSWRALYQNEVEKWPLNQPSNA